ncbi:sortase A [Colwellia chukchiensis]|uniref:Sortase A n=2 Tax=Colwellia chukchiensis TaxID=641665 RepID=A0A1H7RYD6_9GAMM|nr:sortase A [Colwellia chukchiensis]
MGKIIPLLALVFGLLMSLHASWLPAKAWLSQQLIYHSWQQALAAQEQGTAPLAIKPWPWADTFALAELSVPRLAKNIVLLNGGDATSLAFSAAAIAPFNQSHAEQPFVVAGHRDSHFAFLQQLLLKDIINLTDVHGHQQSYQVTAIRVIDGTAAHLPLPANGAHLVLITCYPFQGITATADQRYLVIATPLASKSGEN